MAKGKEEKKKKGDDALDMDEDEVGFLGKVVMGLVGFLIVLIWLAILGILIKMDVGGFGSTVLFPMLKDVPYVRYILPGIEEYDASDDGYRYDSVEDAVVRIKELEVLIEELKAAGNSSEAQISELTTAATELSRYKAAEAAFEEEKNNFYDEVVFSDRAPDIEQYKKYYELINPQRAEEIYRQVVEQVEMEKDLKDYVETYSNMKPKAAAAIFDTMTDDFALVARILDHMEPANRGDILAAMDERNAAILTQILEP